MKRKIVIISLVAGLIIAISLSIFVMLSVQNKYIAKDKAKAIALEHAGVKESEVRIKKIKLDYDDGIADYEIEFRKGRTEYEYRIDAVNGTILEFDMDNN